ncbi:putative Peptidyl-prolyl cis-trans isomerase CYP59 [Blattamonas nauphoetae]|uniref:peptidylprolyl isomerase n=1 Tax=Blattamonas nauphoetae TaxID=2049346 RepID=A0ABQ9Y4H7_9EUKA|nr:putative Peptidyl-prolyl cis-trans isomerase CYP59 [Blattamonas nauphoetae]
MPLSIFVTEDGAWKSNAVPAIVPSSPQLTNHDEHVFPFFSHESHSSHFPFSFHEPETHRLFTQRLFRNTLFITKSVEQATLPEVHSTLSFSSFELYHALRIFILLTFGPSLCDETQQVIIQSDPASAKIRRDQALFLTDAAAQMNSLLEVEMGTRQASQKMAVESLRRLFNSVYSQSSIEWKDNACSLLIPQNHSYLPIPSPISIPHPSTGSSCLRMFVPSLVSSSAMLRTKKKQDSTLTLSTFFSQTHNQPIPVELYSEYRLLYSIVIKVHSALTLASTLLPPRNFTNHISLVTSTAVVPLSPNSSLLSCIPSSEEFIALYSVATALSNALIDNDPLPTPKEDIIASTWCESALFTLESNDDLIYALLQPSPASSPPAMSPQTRIAKAMDSMVNTLLDLHYVKHSFTREIDTVVGKHGWKLLSLCSDIIDDMHTLVITHPQHHNQILSLISHLVFVLLVSDRKGVFGLDDSDSPHSMQSILTNFLAITLNILHPTADSLNQSDLSLSRPSARTRGTRDTDSISSLSLDSDVSDDRLDVSTADPTALKHEIIVIFRKAADAYQHGEDQDSQTFFSRGFSLLIPYTRDVEQLHSINDHSSIVATTLPIIPALTSSLSVQPTVAHLTQRCIALFRTDQQRKISIRLVEEILAFKESFTHQTSFHPLLQTLFTLLVKDNSFQEAFDILPQFIAEDVQINLETLVSTILQSAESPLAILFSLQLDESTCRDIARILIEEGRKQDLVQDDSQSYFDIAECLFLSHKLYEDAASAPLEEAIRLFAFLTTPPTQTILPANQYHRILQRIVQKLSAATHSLSNIQHTNSSSLPFIRNPLLASTQTPLSVQQLLKKIRSANPSGPLPTRPSRTPTRTISPHPTLSSQHSVFTLSDLEALSALHSSHLLLHSDMPANLHVHASTPSETLNQLIQHNHHTPAANLARHFNLPLSHLINSLSSFSSSHPETLSTLLSLLDSSDESVIVQSLERIAESAQDQLPPPNLFIQGGDPSGTGLGGDSIWGILHGQSSRFFQNEITPHLRHDKVGVVCMANAGPDKNASQFYITLSQSLPSRDGKFTIFGQVTEGLEILEKFNDVLLEQGKPLQNSRIYHTIVLHDPFSDPDGFASLVPVSSPKLKPEKFLNDLPEDFEEIVFHEDQTGELEVEKIAARQARSDAVALEILGDLPSADITPDENTLFICKLNSATEESGLIAIFNQFGRVKECSISRNPLTGQSRQFGFIKFSSVEEAENAYTHSFGLIIDDRHVRLDYSQSTSAHRSRAPQRSGEHVRIQETLHQLTTRQRQEKMKVHRQAEREIERKQRRNERERREEERKHATFALKKNVSGTTGTEGYSYVYADTPRERPSEQQAHGSSHRHSPSRRRHASRSPSPRRHSRSHRRRSWSRSPSPRRSSHRRH